MKRGFKVYTPTAVINYGLSKSLKIRNFPLQECVSNDRAEIRVDTRILTDKKFKYAITKSLFLICVRRSS